MKHQRPYIELRLGHQENTNKHVHSFARQPDISGMYVVGEKGWNKRIAVVVVVVAV